MFRVTDKWNRNPRPRLEPPIASLEECKIEWSRSDTPVYRISGVGVGVSCSIGGVQHSSPGCSFAGVGFGARVDFGWSAATRSVTALSKTGSWKIQRSCCCFKSKVANRVPPKTKRNTQKNSKRKKIDVGRKTMKEEAVGGKATSRRGCCNDLHQRPRARERDRVRHN